MTIQFKLQRDAWGKTQARTLQAHRHSICLSMLILILMTSIPTQAQDSAYILPQLAAAQRLQRDDLLTKGNAAILQLKSYYASHNNKLPQQTSEMDEWLNNSYRKIIGKSTDPTMFVNSVGQQRSLGILRIMADPRAAQVDSDGDLPNDWNADPGAIVVVVGSDSKAVVYIGVGSGPSHDFKVVDCAPEKKQD